MPNFWYHDRVGEEIDVIFHVSSGHYVVNDAEFRQLIRKEIIKEDLELI